MVAESLGKKKKGYYNNFEIKDNHSVMQLYLDGFKIIFYFFYVHNNNSNRLNNYLLMNLITFYVKKYQYYVCSKKASEKVLKKNIPFRSFEIKRRNEK